jgi:phosphotransferase family enzyme/choline/ethanolamine kinase
VEQLLRGSSLFAGENIQIRPLHGGITNRNFVVATKRGEFVVRIPGERTELLGIDRAYEAEAAQRAAELGIGPGVLGLLDEVGTLVTELVDGHHLEPTPFVERLADVVDLIRRFHASGPLGGAFPIHRIVEWHARDASAYGVMAPPGNVLFSGDRVWLLDFEYAGMNEVFFDLGNLSVSSELAPDADERLLTLYFGQITKASWARLQLMKMMSEFREGMWAVVQQAISTLDTDFVIYANERLGNCERLARRPEFEGWLVDAANPIG